jgi:hypothetical protein
MQKLRSEVVGDTGDDRRAFPRTPARLPVVLKVDREQVAGWTSDISPGGMFIETAAALPYAARFEAEVALPALSLPTRLACVVRWRDERGLGVAFETPRAQEVWAINRLRDLPAGR